MPILATADELYKIDVKPNLADYEIDELNRFVQYLRYRGQYVGLAGGVLVTGEPRQGKGLFSAWLCHRIKSITNKRILSDTPFTDIFGEEWEIFNEDVLLSEIDKMQIVAQCENMKGITDNQKRKKMQEITDKWVTEEGEVLLKDSVLHFDEFHRVAGKFKTVSTTNITMGSILRYWGHLDLLLLGITQSEDDLDRYNILPFMSHHVKCSMSKTRPNTVEADLFEVQWSRSRMCLDNVNKRPFKIFIDGGKPQPQLGLWRKQVDKKIKLSGIKKEIYECYDGCYSKESAKTLDDIYKAVNISKDDARTYLRELIEDEILDGYCYFNVYRSKSSPMLKFQSLKRDN